MLVGVRERYGRGALYLNREYLLNLGGHRTALRCDESVLLPALIQRGEWEPHIFSIFDRYISSEKSYIDLGAFVGTSVLYGARLAKHCYAVEPNPLSYQFLLENISLNSELLGKITTLEACIWHSVGHCTLTAPVKPYGSAASIRHKSGPACWEVEALTFEEFLQRFQIKDVNFIKMDIEGAESIVLPTMKHYLRRWRPTVLVSIHAFNYDHPTSETAAVIDSLSHYHFLYRRNGLPLDVEAVLSGHGLESHTSENSDILATDIPWLPSES